MKAHPRINGCRYSPYGIKHPIKVTNEVLLSWETQLSIFRLSKVKYAQSSLTNAVQKRPWGYSLKWFGNWGRKREIHLCVLLFSWVKVLPCWRLVVFYLCLWERMRGSVVCVCGECACSGATRIGSQPSPATKNLCCHWQVFKTIMCLSLLICKMGTIIAPASYRVLVKTKWKHSAWYIMNVSLWFIPAEIVWLVFHPLFTIQVLNVNSVLRCCFLYFIVPFVEAVLPRVLELKICSQICDVPELLIVLSWTISAPLRTPVSPCVKGLNKSSTYLTGLCWDWVIFKSFWYLLLSFLF